MYLEKTNSKWYLHLSVHSSTIDNSQDMESTEMPIDRWMDNKYERIINNNNEYY